MAAIDGIVMVHHGGDERSGCGTVVVGLMNQVPECIEDVAGGLDISIGSWQLEVAHLSVKGRRHLFLGKGHGEVGKEGESEDFEVVRETDGVDDGAWSEVDERSRTDVAVDEVEVDATLATDDEPQTVVVDNEGRLLMDKQTEHLRVAVQDAYLIAEIDVFADLFNVGHEDVLHPHHVHQFGLTFVGVHISRSFTAQR